VSSFKLNTTPVGDTLLADNELTSVFPAVVQDPVSGRTFYFSGDFANNDIPFWTSRFKNIDKRAKTFFYSENENDSKRFFWLYYKPLITGIFTEYQSAVAGK